MGASTLKKSSYIKYSLKKSSYKHPKGTSIFKGAG